MKCVFTIDCPECGDTSTLSLSRGLFRRNYGQEIIYCGDRNCGVPAAIATNLPRGISITTGKKVAMLADAIQKLQR